MACGYFRAGTCWDLNASLAAPLGGYPFTLVLYLITQWY